MNPGDGLVLYEQKLWAGESRKKRMYSSSSSSSVDSCIDGKYAVQRDICGYSL